MGVVVAFLNRCGTVPVTMEVLNILVRDGAKRVAQRFSSSPETPSDPEAFEVAIVRRCFSTVSPITGENSSKQGARLPVSELLAVF